MSNSPTANSNSAKATSPRCADCGEKLNEVRLHGTDVDQCPKCRAYWFDKGKLRGTIDRTDDDLRIFDLELWKNQDKFNLKASPLKCPKCPANLIDVNYENSQVKIHACPACHGLWIRQDELKAIMAHLENEIVSLSLSDLEKNSLHKFVEIFSGKTGVISEIKDFLASIYIAEMRLAVEHPQFADKVMKIAGAASGTGV